MMIHIEGEDNMLDDDFEDLGGEQYEEELEALTNGDKMKHFLDELK